MFNNKICYCTYRSDDLRYNNKKKVCHENAWGHLFISQNTIICQSFLLSNSLSLCMYSQINCQFMDNMFQFEVIFGICKFYRNMNSFLIGKNYS